MAFDLVQWRFLTKVLGWTLDPALGPSTEDAADDITDTASTFDPATADTDTVKQVAGRVAAWAQTLRDTGRSQAASGMDPAVWDAHVQTVRSTITDTREMRTKIKAELAKPDLEAEMRTELEALQRQVNDALVEALDLEPAHGPTNHVKITREGLGRRSMLGIDPRQRGNAHPDGAMRATRFATQDAFLDALDTACSSAAYTDAIDDQMDLSDPDAPVLKADKTGYFSIEFDLEDVFGTDYQDCVNGLTFTGSGGQRTKLFEEVTTPGSTTPDPLGDTVGVVPTNLEGGKVRASFEFLDGAWELSTLFPVVASGTDRKMNPDGTARTPEMRFDVVSDQWQKKDPARGDAWCPYDPDTQTWITP